MELEPGRTDDSPFKHPLLASLTAELQPTLVGPLIYARRVVEILSSVENKTDVITELYNSEELTAHERRAILWVMTESQKGRDKEDISKEINEVSGALHHHLLEFT